MAPAVDYLVGKYFGIIDLTYCSYGIGTMMRAYYKRLGLIVRYTAYAHVAFHLMGILIELCPEWCALYIMYRTVKPVLSIHHHACAPGPQM